MTFEHVPPVKPPCGHDVIARAHGESFYRCAGCTEMLDASVIGVEPLRSTLVAVANVARWNLARIAGVSALVIITYLSMRGRASDVPTLLILLGNAHAFGTGALAWYFVRSRLKPVVRRHTTAAPGGKHDRRGDAG
jgi:hypothetical protein